MDLVNPLVASLVHDDFQDHQVTEFSPMPQEPFVLINALAGLLRARSCH